jgi:hypothetical protein
MSVSRFIIPRVSGTIEAVLGLATVYYSWPDSNLALPSSRSKASLSEAVHRRQDLNTPYSAASGLPRIVANCSRLDFRAISRRYSATGQNFEQSDQ